MTTADFIVSTTGADRPIVDRERFQAIRKVSGNRPVFILDLGAPRDFDPAVGQIDDNVFLYDIDDLEATCDRNRKLREAEIVRAESIIEDETEVFMRDIYHRATGPIIQRLRREWHEISRSEMDLLFRKLPGLEERERKSVEKCVERIVNKLLHPPLETLKDEARDGTPHGLLDALRRLFHLRDG